MSVNVVAIGGATNEDPDRADQDVASCADWFADGFRTGRQGSSIRLGGTAANTGGELPTITRGCASEACRGSTSGKRICKSAAHD
jgi:hypothetical protein